ncbi:MAG: T9SS type A sorting domain-containing protein [Candidatus Cloacimonetes bacterium]|nr:T9SS type A sorting domain-containing protein [Candidatus Cloacimonadota bacterium]
MKKMIIALVLIGCLPLIALEQRVENLALELNIEQGYSVFQNGEMTIYQQKKGAPAIPQLGTFIQIEAGREVKSVEVVPVDIMRQQLPKPLLPVQEAVAYSQRSGGFIEPLPQYYNLKSYPESWLSSFNQGFCGEHNILSVTINALQYEPESKTAVIPTAFYLNIETTPGELPQHVNNLAVAKVLAGLGLESGATRENAGYLAIAPMMFQNSLQPLLDWRSGQGYEVYFRTTGEISAVYEGEDLAAKIRACISDMQQTYGIDYVTLAADHQHIPARNAFAFDCAYGSHAGENDLACDMYYSCLDGNWNADADTLYGEDEDEVDYYPEVFVGRIPANTAGELASYISKLLQYERGQIDDYNRAGGLSMELWDGSASEQCQQYIYDNYFPDNYEIDFLYGTENNEENAFAMLSAGQNIVQHTGHAWINVLSLEDYGHIYSYNIPDLTNDWGGMFYSIGCWSNSFDNESIGEEFVREAGRNFLGYVGNSSYGWGSPSAPQFGFSEFYQNEYFRILFEGETNTMELGAVQALQKLAFIPYFQGTSIYKWVGYELNLCGDAAALLFTDNPPELEVNANHTETDLYIQVVNSENVPVPGAVITYSGEYWQTGSNGLAVLPWNQGIEENYYIFAKGYRLYTLTMNDVLEQPVLNIYAAPENIMPETEYELDLQVINPSTEEINFRVLANVQPEQIDLDYDAETYYTVPAGDSLLLDSVGIFLAAEYNLMHDTMVTIELELLDAQNNVITSAGVTLPVHSASVYLQTVDWQEDDFLAGASIPVDFTFMNQVALDNIELLQLTFSGDAEGILNFNPSSLLLDIENMEAGEEIAASVSLELSPDLPADFYTTAWIEFFVQWSGGKTWQDSFAFYLGNGNLQLWEGFEAGNNWNGDEEWQTVTTYAYEGSNSLSCRPAEPRNYLLNTPLLTWAPGTEVAFWYRSKMPMYGEDGFFLKLITDDLEEVIVFLGSGGALNTDTGRPFPEVYLESEWVYYQFALDNVLASAPYAGENYQLVFDFNYSEVIENFSEYATMEDIGVFIDNFTVQQTGFVTELIEDEIPSASMKSYPNPYIFNASRQPLQLSFYLPVDGNVQVDLYDIRGRKKMEILDQMLAAGNQTISWQPDIKFAAGIYFVQVKSSEFSSISKILFLR